MLWVRVGRKVTGRVVTVVGRPAALAFHPTPSVLSRRQVRKSLH